MNKFKNKDFGFITILLFFLISTPAISADGSDYKHFLGITLDEKFWVLIAFILFILLIGKKATKAANTTLDNRSNLILDKINHSENTLSEAKQLLKESQQALAQHKNESNNLINKKRELAEKSAAEYANKIQEELERKSISAEREIKYMHTEATAHIKNKITSITLRAVEDIARNELKDTKSDKIYQKFISDIPKALKS